MVGGDVVEIAPQYAPTSNTAHIGSQALFTILCLAGTALRAQGGGVQG